MDNAQHSSLSEISSMQAVEIANLISKTSSENQQEIFKQLRPPLAVRVFEYLPRNVQKSIICSLEPEKAAVILQEMSPDDRTAFLEELPKGTTSELLKLMSEEKRKLTLTLLGYPKNTVGRLMTTDYIAVKLDWTVQQVLDYVRKNGRDSETINVIYVIDDHGKLIDDIRIKEFLFAALDAKVKDLADYKFVALSVNDVDDQAIKVFLDYDRVALPVVDNQGILIGIVTVDDVLDLMTEQATEDIQKIGGTAALEGPYLQTPFLDLIKKRAGWLVLLFIGEMFTATALGYFEGEIAKAVVLVLFLPLIISSGGNSGSQASTLIIRALAIGELTLQDWWKVMRREVFSGIFLGVILGVIGMMRISLWSAFSDIYGPHWLLVAVTVFFALIGVVLWGSLSGAMLPLILKKMKLDPAVASAPLVATLVDVTGIIIYFITASFILRGTLL